MTKSVNYHKTNDYVQNIFYNPYQKADTNNYVTNIWADYNNSSGKAEPKKKSANPEEIANEIYKLSRSGLRGNSEELMKCMEMIDENNVVSVVYKYFVKYNNSSIFNAITHNVFISSDTRANALKHIKDMYMQAMKNKGMYTDDIDKAIDGHIDYEKNKLGRMNSKDIDKDMKFIYGRRLAGSVKIFQANGKIDAEFNQKQVKDCWLIAAIKSLSVNPKGQEMLNDLISLDDKGNVTVKLKGVDKEYIISKEELEGSNEFAEGDLDVRAIEIAIRKYLQEIGDHTNIFKKIKNRFSGAHIRPQDYDMDKGMHNLSTPYYILFGNSLVSDTQPDNTIIEKIKSGEYSIVVSSHSYYKVKDFSKKHAYATTGADNKYVYLSDPYNTNENLKMTHKDFLKFFDESYSMKF